jgi:uncharacterized membrane protein YphA (DoxX/SURF4 family)
MIFMADQVQIDPISVERSPLEGAVTVTPRPVEPPKVWSPALRIAFRFCFAYFILFSLSNQILLELFPPAQNSRIPELSGLWPLRQITFWTAAHVFRVHHPLVYTGSGSGDKTFDWVQVFCLLIIAGMITAIWSVLDRHRQNYVTLHKWFRLFMRFVMASELLVYGFAKVIPLQMPFPPLGKLVEPFGDFSPMGVLWWSIGSSRAYEIFAGSAETLAGILLIVPRAATFGALVALADMFQVFMLNMTYDVPVKLFSFHLILFSLFLLAPELPRIISFFFSNRPTGPSSQPALFRSLRANRIALILQLAFGAYLVGMNIYGGVQAWHTYGAARPKPSLYGIWNVEQMSIDGQERSALLNDYDRWRRVIFDYPTFFQFQRIDNTAGGYGLNVSEQTKTLTLSKGTDKNWKAVFSFARPAPDQLTLDGTLDGHKIHMQLKLFDINKYTLVNRGFHWINEYPFQR